MDEIEALLNRLREQGERVWIAGPQPSVAVTELATALGVTLPASFQQFLLRFGAIGIGDSYVSGIIDGQAIGEGTGWAFNDTRRFRDEHALPVHLLVIQADEDAPYCIDLSRPNSAGEFSVVCFDLTSAKITQRARDFRFWLRDYLLARIDR